MLLLHIAYSEEDAAARIRFAFAQSAHADCLQVFEIHRKKTTPEIPPPWQLDFLRLFFRDSFAVGFFRANIPTSPQPEASHTTK